MRNKKNAQEVSEAGMTEAGDLRKLRRELQRAQKRLKKYEKLYAETAAERDELRAERDRLQEQYDCIANSASWKITKPVRGTLDFFKRLSPLRTAAKVLRSLRWDGLRATARKIRQKLAERRRRRKRRHVDLSKIPMEQRVREECTCFDRSIKFSILVPLYNTPVPFLDEMIASVVGQTYSHWELCLADGSDDAHGEVCRAVTRWREKDPRILYRKLDRNLGISENTNACLDMATGEYIALFDHDDILHPSALFEMMQAICGQGADYVYTDEATFESPDIRKLITCHFKPDFAPDNLRANNYICHFSAFSREVLEKTGRFRREYDGSQDHDMILRLTANARNVVHIPKLLYFWRSHPKSVAMDISSKTYAIEAGKHAVQDNIRASGYQAKVESSRAFPTIYRIRYRLREEEPEKVSILIPNKNHVRTLRRCIQSVLQKTTYPNYEILIVDNGSDEPALSEYYRELQEHENIRVLHYDRPFNFSAINNYAAGQATGRYLVLLNNDIQIITPGWMEEMMMYVQREDVGAAGAMLYYPDRTIQHAGIVLGLGADRIAGHAFYRYPKGTIGYMGRACYAQDMSAVTAACMMVRAEVYREVGGMDESYPVAFNDVDFCLRIRRTGRLIVWTPFAEAYHYESRTRGRDDGTEARKARFREDCRRFAEQWKDVLEQGDPYYNPNFSLDASFEPK